MGWLKTADDPEERTLYEEWVPTQADIDAFGIETPSGVYFLVNSTELRHVNFQMDPVIPLPTVTPTAKRSKSASSEAERPDTTGRQFRIPPDVENQILALNW